MTQKDDPVPETEVAAPSDEAGDGAWVFVLAALPCLIGLGVLVLIVSRG